ncbi:MAG: glycosyltransferase, partial [Lachnospiraceae bacterium]|nr:glycosyltransferase [Lachnospiraceae bacterium]
SRLLDILRILVFDRKMDAQLLIVGEGHLQEALCSKAAALSLEDRVVFTGSLDDVASALCAMDLFVLPSLYEGLGIVNIEAQAAGLPILVSDNVPDEARMGDHFHKLSLSASDAQWADQILKIKPLSKEERSASQHIESIQKKGYDLSTAAWELEKYYRMISSHTAIRKACG